MAGTIGIAWYRREDYDKLRAWFHDGDTLPDTYDEWRKKALETWRQLSDQGHVLEEVFLDRETFGEWCRSRNVKPNRKARSQYCAHYVAGQALSRKKQPPGQ